MLATIPDSTLKPNEVQSVDPSILDQVELAALLRISVASIPSLRSRTPEKLPLPFQIRPLLWRREAVVRWMEKREQAEAERIQRKFGPALTVRRR